MTADDKLDMMIDDAIKKCMTHAHLAKINAGDLRNDGFNGLTVADLIKQCELALKFAHLYQGYMNCVSD